MEQVESYIHLIDDFLNHVITAHEFERIYLEKFKNEKPFLNKKIFLTLDWLFAEIDAFTDFPLDPQLNPDDYINEDQLRESAAKALAEIKILK